MESTLIRTPYAHPAFLAVFRQQIPPSYRWWNGSAWVVDTRYASVAERLVAEYFPPRPAPAPRPIAPKPTLATEVPAGLARPKSGKLTQPWRKAVLKHWLGGDGELMLAALHAIWLRQTADEQETETTNVDNAMGFSGVDGKILTSFGNQVNGGKALSTRQWEVLAKCLPRYAGQILDNALLDIESRFQSAFAAATVMALTLEQLETEAETTL